MAIGKWIGGALGWVLAGGSVLGAVAGYCIGSLIDEATKGNDDDGNYADDRDYQQAGNPFGHAYRQRPFEEDRNSFLFSLLVLSSYIIKADGKIMHSEMEFVRQFLRRNFGETAVGQGEEILLKLFEMQKQQGSSAFKETIRRSCIEISFHSNEGQRLQMLSYLVLIAKADGIVSPEEVAALKEIASYLKLSEEDIESILSLEGGTGSSSRLEKAYKILGISPTATDDEVKAAYRKMALRHHPDRVASLGEDIRKAAEKKFQEINEAKESIFKARGL